MNTKTYSCDKVIADILYYERITKPAADSLHD